MTINYKFPYWDCQPDKSHTRKLTKQTRLINLVIVIKSLPIPDDVKLEALKDLLWLTKNSQEMADAIKLDVSNITKFGKALGKPNNMFSWAKSKNGHEFWWKIFQLID
jgi:hypothetical protein